MQITWTSKSAKQELIDLDRANLDAIKTQGVYVIYQTGNPPKSVYVGNGDIGERLASHRSDKRFEASRKKGSLYVAFATVSVADQEGVETYLAKLLQPTIGERHPDVREIQVNPPFAA